MNQTPKNQAALFCRLAIGILFLLPLMMPPAYAASAQFPDTAKAVDAAMELVSFARTPGAELNPQALTMLADFVLAAKPVAESDLPKKHKATGAYYEFDTNIDFISFMKYGYSSRIPSALTSPASLRYSLWRGPKGEAQALPQSWSVPSPKDAPQVIRGLQRDGITPDLTTGVYYEYDLIRTLIVFNHKGRPVLISISKQADISDVGKKGFILGDDDDWNYHYTGEIGSAKAGLGWVKSYIYDYFAVSVFVETGASPAVMRSGVFQWIRAGWSGINFVKSEHVIKGIKRHANNSKSILESPRLPDAERIASTYSRLCAQSRDELLEKYAALHRVRHDLAVSSGKLGKNEKLNHDVWANATKEQMIEALMLEYFKNALGKSSLLGKKILASIFN